MISRMSKREYRLRRQYESETLMRPMEPATRNMLITFIVALIALILRG